MSLAARVAALVPNLVYGVLGPALRAHEDRIMAAVSQQIADRQVPHFYRGFVADGSYDPTDGTIEVVIGSTYGLIGDDGDLPATLKKVPLLSPMVGDLCAPIGGERVTLFRDYGALVHHSDDDSPGTVANGSPGVQAGERIIAHRNVSTLEYDAYTHLSNDGSTAGDGLGGTRSLAGAFLKSFTAAGHTITADDTVKFLSAVSADGHVFKLDDQLRIASLTSTGGHNLKLDDAHEFVSLETKNGLLHNLDDATQQITHIAGNVSHLLDAAAQKLTHTASGLTYTILDGAGNAISHVAPSVGLGALASSLSAPNALILKTHMDAFQASLLAQRLADQIKLVGLLNTVGTMSSGQLAAALATLVAGFLPGISVPAGSSIVKAAL